MKWWIFSVTYYKLIDKIDDNTWKVVERIGLESDAYSASTLNVDDKSLGLLTTRDISSVYSLDIDRVNKRKIYKNIKWTFWEYWKQKSANKTFYKIWFRT